MGIFLDITKAFDSISHELLLHKLKSIIGYNTFWRWFKSYLSNRLQAVKINGFESDSCRLKYRIPQGTVLGPILFSIYINDLLLLNLNGSISAFADDTVLFFEGDNWNEVETKANIGLSIVNKWLANNSLMLNKSKSVFIPFCISKTNKPEHISIKLHKSNCKD